MISVPAQDPVHALVGVKSAVSIHIFEHQISEANGIWIRSLESEINRQVGVAIRFSRIAGRTVGFGCRFTARLRAKRDRV